jgi:hypothetical protein
VSDQVSAVLAYAGREYVIVQPAHEASDYQWRDGNYSCDCNRSDFIQDQCDGSFPDLPCGETIVLVSLAGALDAEQD